MFWNLDLLLIWFWIRKCEDSFIFQSGSNTIPRIRNSAAIIATSTPNRSPVPSTPVSHGRYQKKHTRNASESKVISTNQPPVERKCWVYENCKLRIIYLTWKWHFQFLGIMHSLKLYSHIIDNNLCMEKVITARSWCHTWILCIGLTLHLVNFWNGFTCTLHFITDTDNNWKITD